MMRFIAIPIGFILIAAAPLALWRAESQKRAIEFRSAIEVNADNIQNAYVRTRALAKAEESVPCPVEVSAKSANCIYVFSEVKEYQQSERETCSMTKPTGTIVRTLEDKCDESGKCTPCYVVSENSWKVLRSESKFARFAVGNYKVAPDSSANVIGAETYTRYYKQGEYDSVNFTSVAPESYPGSKMQPTSPKLGEVEVKHSYIEEGAEILVTGQADKGEISTGEKVFVISTQNYQQTLKSLESQDNASKWLLRLLSFAMTVSGFVIIMVNLMAIANIIIERVPVVGNLVSKQLRGLAAIIGIVLGTGYWLLAFALVLLLKNVLAIGLVFVVLVVIIITGAYLYKSGRTKQTIKPA